MTFTVRSALRFSLAAALAVGFFLSYIPPADAECSRDDVEYFLKKGFSREQVVAICEQAKPKSFGGSEARNQGEYESYSEELEQRIRIERRLQKEEEDVALLKAAIAGEDIRVTDNWIDFKSPFCVAAGNNPDVEARVRACPLVLYRVYFKGLRVKDYERKYLVFGAREIEVVGKIKRKLLDDFKAYPASISAQLLDAFKASVRSDGTFIPIRKDYPIGRVQEVLRGYAQRASK